MDMKQALDILIAVGICGLTSSESGLVCSDCPLYTDDDEESPIHCKSWTPKDVAEAIRLLKDVKVLDPNPNLSGKWVLAKMLKEPERPEVIIPINHLTKEQLKNTLESLNIDVELLEEQRRKKMDKKYVEIGEVKECIHAVQRYRESLQLGALDLDTDGAMIKILRRVEQIPAADVVEVVRCKDCKRFLQMETSPSYDGKCLGYGYLVEANHFCSYGERKEGEEDANI